MHPGEFHDYDVEAYQAIDDYARPFNSIYYIGSGIYRTPSMSFETDDILHADHDPGATEYLSNQGLNTTTVDVTQHVTEKDFDLIILAHLTSEDPIIEENLKSDGSVICTMEHRAEKLDQRFNLEASYRDGDLELSSEINDSQMYFFTR